MIINSLGVTDYRVFSGKHEFDLAPRTKYKKSRPIVLFGGLNGAGKTSIISGVKLALYGKESLGATISQKVYDEHLRSSIHKARNTIVQPQSASVELNFSYANMGVLRTYSVKRNWMLKGAAVKEALTIMEDGKSLSELSSEQCQGFLNELVPIGVSELFFFDGEKIKELAEDTAGGALGGAIKKLLGLDLIETLNADLATLIRQSQTSKSTKETAKESKKLQEILGEAEDQARRSEEKENSLRGELTAVLAEIAKVEKHITASGGAWAKTRDSERGKLQSLLSERDGVESSIRDVLGGSFPLSIASDFVRQTLDQLESEAEVKSSVQSAKVVKKKITSLKKRFAESFDKKTTDDALALVKEVFAENRKSQKLLHDVSDRQHDNIKSVLHGAENVEKPKLKKLLQKQKSLSKKISGLEENQSRAPHDDALKPMVSELSALQKSAGEIRSKVSESVEDRRKFLRAAIDTTRQLKKLDQESSQSVKAVAGVEMAKGTRGVLSEFVEKMAHRKVADLEAEFVTSIEKLSRKEDINMRARIDPSNFSVSIEDENGIELDKNELSAGEKQIYAIAILEALARTSGRKLPIIIDTPLGRLDSVHRGKLVDNYFPFASHQVIILSTDTEVDESYYRRFSSYISHAFKLEYNPGTGASTAAEGYFWKTKEQELVSEIA